MTTKTATNTTPFSMTGWLDTIRATGGRTSEQWDEHLRRENGWAALQSRAVALVSYLQTTDDPVALALAQTLSVVAIVPPLAHLGLTGIEPHILQQAGEGLALAEQAIQALRSAASPNRQPETHRPRPAERKVLAEGEQATIHGDPRDWKGELRQGLHGPTLGHVQVRASDLPRVYSPTLGVLPWILDSQHPVIGVRDGVIVDAVKAVRQC